MAVKCAAKSLLERKQGLQRGVWEQNSAESAANDEHPARHFVQLLGNRTEPSEERRNARWMRLGGRREGDFIPLGKGRGRSQLGFESEPAPIFGGAGSVA